MGFREPLDISIFSEPYQRWLGGAYLAGNNYVREDPNYVGEQPEMEAIPQEVYNQRVVPKDTPMRIGYKKSPLHFSTSTELSLVTHLCWDVNGYYKTLGVDWRATRKQLMEAYRDSDGPNNAYKTYVLKQLLNRVVRPEYDSSPLGFPYVNDIYVQEAIKREASRQAGLRSMYGKTVTPEQVLDEQGYRMEAEQAPSTKILSEVGSTFDEWLWAYYIWRASHPDASRLRSWQQLLVAAANEQGQVMKIGLGFVGKTDLDFVLGEQEGLSIFYLNEKTEPTYDIASRAVRQHLLDTQHIPTLDGELK